METLDGISQQVDAPDIPRSLPSDNSDGEDFRSRGRPMTQSTTVPTPADAIDIQGNLIGFNKDHQQLLFVAFPSQSAGRALLVAVHPELNDARDVLEDNAEAKRIVREGEDPLSLNTSGVNIVISFAGLTILGASELASFPSEFQQPMAARAGVLGDVDASAPANWVSPFTTPTNLHAMIIVAADQPDLLADRTSAVSGLIANAGCTVLGTQAGDVRPAPETGHEHFGFKDGISQPGIRGLTTSSKGGEPIAAGEFLIGYEDQDGNVSGSGGQPQPQPQPGQPGYPSPPVQPSPPLPPWARNGSFVVYRRLQQNVKAFQAFLASQPVPGLSPDQLGAKLLGRWPSGAPLEHVPGLSASVDPSVADPSVNDPNVLHDDHINNFDYQAADADGHLMPRAAHIRKSNPRDETPPGHDESDRHRILRRGIPYGPELDPNEPDYPGSGSVPPDQDRGLLFLCYQASILNGFEFIQTQWVNQPDFPQGGDGTDPIISQNQAAPTFNLPPSNPHVQLARWVTTTGGEYFFSPSISGIATLAAGG